jgi:hypothetical protein
LFPVSQVLYLNKFNEQSDLYYHFKKRLFKSPSQCNFSNNINSLNSFHFATVAYSKSTEVNGSGSSASVPGGTDEIAKSMMGVDIDLAEIFDSVLSKLVNYLNYVFEPVQHTFTIDVMSNHIQNISILLFILTALILIFFISFLFNMTLFLFSDRLMRYFTNKYIL